MIGTLNTGAREVTIIGAGIAGMLAAYTLDKNGYRVTLLEKQQQAGGLLQTVHTKYGIAEAAANSVLASPPVKSLCRDLGVELVEVRKESRARYVLRNGKLRRFPLTIRETLDALGHIAFTPSINHEDQLDLAEWGRRHLGDAGVEYLLAPFVRGIYGVQPTGVGVSAAFPNLLIPPGRSLLATWLKKAFKRSAAKRERALMCAPKNGMGNLVARLEERLTQRLGERFLKGVKVTEPADAPNVLIATPAYKAAELLGKEYYLLAQSLREVRYTPLASVTAFVDRNSFTRPISGVGVLVPASEKRKCLGILFSSSSFKGRVTDESRWASFTLMLGGSKDRQWVDAGDEEIHDAVRNEMSEILGIRGEPLEIIINRWPRAIPQYSIELPKVWACARQTWCAVPGRILFGNYTGLVSLRGLIESAASLGSNLPFRSN
ncbi:MAG TPA: FAD-dependent oxidoreductase [Pyrinomonadaceae bacterium]|nr:FAD-dependent oxidoreductase [Pyrinomonadaceae bacterium]